MTTIDHQHNDFFACKRFIVKQDEEVFKITTDSLALGAAAPLEGQRRILEIGSGTGIVSLMLAQRYEHAFMEGWEISEAAEKLCRFNFAKSPYADRLKISCGDFIAEYGELEQQSYDAIISNPPYHSNGLMPSDVHLALAKHDNQDLIPSIFNAGQKILSEQGVICLLLPSYRQKEICRLAEEMGYHVQSWIKINGFENQPPNRHIITWQKLDGEPRPAKSFTVYNKDRSYHASWQRLLSDFLIQF